MIDDFAVFGDAASDGLEIVQLLLFTKSFDGPTPPTGTVTRTFTITNPGSATATDLSFSDDLDDVISGLIVNSLPALPCGAGSSLSGVSLLTLTGGELPPTGGVCSFDVEVLVPITATQGSFLNATSDLFRAGARWPTRRRPSLRSLAARVPTPPTPSRTDTSTATRLPGCC